MNISNSNLLSISAASSEASSEGMMVQQISTQVESQLMEDMSATLALLTVDSKSLEEGVLEGDFGSMLTRQLAEAEIDNSIQLIENEAVFVDVSVDNVLEPDTNVIARLELDIEVSQDKANTVVADMGVNFIDNLKLQDGASEGINPQSINPQSINPQSGASEVKVIQNITEKPDALIETPSAVVTALNLAEFANQHVTDSGDKLPLSRQTVSVIMPNQLASIADPVQQTVKSLHLISESSELHEVDTKVTDLDSEAKLFSKGKAEIELNQAEILKTEKSQIKQPVPDQNGLVIKENATSVFTQLNPQTMSISAAQPSPTLPTAMQTLQLSPQANASQWGEALGEKVSLLLNKQLNTAEIRIDPPHLGKLDIQIQLKDDSATIVINTQHAQTRDLIDAASVRLKEFLQEAGYNSVDVDVSHRDQSMAQDDFLPQDDNAKNDSNSEQQLSSQQELSEIQNSDLYLKIDDGRIDYFA